VNPERTAVSCAFYVALRPRSTICEPAYGLMSLNGRLPGVRLAQGLRTVTGVFRLAVVPSFQCHSTRRPHRWLSKGPPKADFRATTGATSRARRASAFPICYCCPPRRLFRNC
jgi:hypothetical protein